MVIPVNRPPVNALLQSSKTALTSNTASLANPILLLTVIQQKQSDHPHSTSLQCILLVFPLCIGFPHRIRGLSTSLLLTSIFAFLLPKTTKQDFSKLKSKSLVSAKTSILSFPHYAASIFSASLATSSWKSTGPKLTLS